ncbi:unnamed protein product, partial [Rotaria sp. Silwood2]
IPLQCCQYYFHIRPLAYYFYQDLVPIKRHEVGLPDHIFEHESINEQHNDEHSIIKLSYKQEVAQVYEWFYTHCSSFRSTCYIITSIWSIGFLLEFLGRLTLILIHLATGSNTGLIVGLTLGLGIPALIGIAVGGYFWKKRRDNHQTESFDLPMVKKSSRIATKTLTR